MIEMFLVIASLATSGVRSFVRSTRRADSSPCARAVFSSKRPTLSQVLSAYSSG